MTEIMIGNAPLRFQPYLKRADEKPNYDNLCQKGNGKIDCEQEAITAVIECSKDNQENAGEIEDYLVQSGFYLSEQPVKIKSAPEEPAGSVKTDPDPIERSFRLLVTPGIGLSASRYNYGEFPDAMRNTPPHFTDPGGQPGTVSYRSRGFMWSPAPSIKLTADLFQYLTLSYEYSSNPSFGGITGGISDTELEQPYLTNPHPLDPNGASTFIAYDKGLTSQRFTVGINPFIKQNKVEEFHIWKVSGNEHTAKGGNEELAVEVEGGVARESYALTNGWDHPWSYEYSGGIEVYQKQPVTKWGIAGGVNLRILQLGGSELPNFLLGLSGGASFEYYDKNSYSFRLTLGVPFGWKF